MRRALLICWAACVLRAQERVVPVTPETRDLQKLIDSEAAGTRFVFGPGTYRGVEALHPRDGDTFEGQREAVFDGGEPLQFEKAGAVWFARVHATQKEAVFTTSPCASHLKNKDGSKYTIGCTHTRSLFLDEMPLWRVASLQEVAAGKWFFDEGEQKAYIAQDPAGHSFALSEGRDAIDGAAGGVTIRGLTIKHYATGQQHGAITCDRSHGSPRGEAGWVIEGNTISGNHYSGIEILACPASKILNNKLIQNGDLGLAVVASDGVLVEGNEMALNNYAKFDSGWEAGGAKFVEDTHLTVRKNSSHDNGGTGLWADIDCKDTTFTGNSTIGNSDNGIFYEISMNALIENNVSKMNGSGSKGIDPWAYDGQIVISASGGVMVRNNTVAVGPYGNGITIIQQPRGSGKYGPHVAIGNTVSNNTITYLTDVGTTGVAYDPAGFDGKNQFDYNTYHAARMDIHFRWNALGGWQQFQAAGQESHGRMDRVIPKDQ